MAKYFAMIDEERRGPYSLDELHNAGVTPETYVWAKGMSDWERAEDVADICRFYRQRIFDIMHPSSSSQSRGERDTEINSSVIKASDQSQQSYTRWGVELPPESEADYSIPPARLLPLAIIVTFLFFSPLGLIAVMYAIKSQNSWKQAEQGKNSHGFYSASDIEELRRNAHDYARSAKMWIGLTICISIIFMAFFVRKLF